MKTFYLTDVGKIRTHNEDSVTILKNASGEQLMIVADGMGGHRAGEVASSMVVTHLGKRFQSMSSVGYKLDAINWLKDNIVEVNKNIIDYTKDNPETKGMGTTVVAAILTDEFLIFANLGDSSGYVMKKNQLYKVTKDHTITNLLVAAGDLTEEEAKFHPQKNVLTKALGSVDKVVVDIFDVDTSIEAILLCSDGLTNMMNKEQIEKVISDPVLEIEEKVIKMINKCNSRGGTDNISIALLTRESGETK